MVDGDARESGRTAARDGGSLTLTVSRPTVTSRNVLARPAKVRRAAARRQPHGHRAAPGALDNGSSGTASVPTAWMRASVCAAFGAEEEGWWQRGDGEGDAAGRRAARAMINLDMTGLGTVDLVGNADLAQQAKTSAELGIKAMRTTWPSNFGAIT
jgi:hypothetical protein